MAQLNRSNDTGANREGPGRITIPQGRFRTQQDVIGDSLLQGHQPNQQDVLHAIDNAGGQYENEILGIYDDVTAIGLQRVWISQILWGIRSLVGLLRHQAEHPCEHTTFVVRQAVNHVTAEGPTGLKAVIEVCEIGLE